MGHKTATVTAHTPDPASSSELGLGLIGMLVSLVILAGLAAAVLASQDGTGGDHQAHSNQTTVDASPAKAADDISEAAREACVTDYAAVIEAASEFDTLEGRQPATISELQSFLKDPLSSTHFSITIDPNVPGRIEVTTTGHPALPGDGNCAYSR